MERFIGPGAAAGRPRGFTDGPRRPGVRVLGPGPAPGGTSDMLDALCDGGPWKRDGGGSRELVCLVVIWGFFDTGDASIKRSDRGLRLYS